MAELLIQAPARASRGLESTADRLIEEHEKVRGLEARLRGARRRRALLALKLVTGGITERAIAALIGVESPHINQWKRKAERELPAKPPLEQESK